MTRHYTNCRTNTSTTWITSTHPAKWWETLVTSSFTSFLIRFVKAEWFFLLSHRVTNLPLQLHSASSSPRQRSTLRRLCLSIMDLTFLFEQLTPSPLIQCLSTLLQNTILWEQYWRLWILIWSVRWAVIQRRQSELHCYRAQSILTWLCTHWLAALTGLQ